MKLLALDIDETTLRHDGTISDNNVKAITHVQKNGGHAVIVTGRPPHATYPVWEMLPVDDICVCFGGALIVNMRTDKVLAATYMQPDTVTDILEFAYSLGIVSQIYREDEILTEYENQYSTRYTTYLKLKPCVITPDIRKIKHNNIIKIVCFCAPEDLRTNIDKFKAEFGDSIGVSASAKTLIEINSPQADKGTGILHLCKLLDIPVSETVAMGDSLIDIPMLLKAHIGIAVANAQKEVLKFADIIAPDCDEDAVAWAVERYFV